MPQFAFTMVKIPGKRPISLIYHTFNYYVFEINILCLKPRVKENQTQTKLQKNPRKGYHLKGSI